jgi:hypothetical protein
MFLLHLPLFFQQHSLYIVEQSPFRPCVSVFLSSLTSQFQHQSLYSFESILLNSYEEWVEDVEGTKVEGVWEQSAVEIGPKRKKVAEG